MSQHDLPAVSMTVLEPTRETSQFGILLIVSVIASATGILFMLAPAMGLPLRIFLTAIVLLTLKYWGSVMVLIAVQADLFFREPQRSAALQGVTGLLTVFLIVALLMFINRNRELLRRAASLPLRSILNSAASVLKGGIAFDSGKAVREIPRIIGATIRGIALLVGCVFVSRILLSTLPNRRTLNADLRGWMLDESSVLKCSLLIAGMIAAWVVCNEISWRQLTRIQARLYLRSVFLTIHHADMRMVVRGRLKLRHLAAREKKQREAAAFACRTENLPEFRR
ncbi:MAG: hypothetical protein H7Z17_13235 [Fuerstia sp.]|nr:hypothetical protein [Fuerstiella sp.]